MRSCFSWRQTHACFSSEASHQPREACSETNVEAPARLQDSQSPSASSYSYWFKFSLLRGRIADWFSPTFIPEILKHNNAPVLLVQIAELNQEVMLEYNNCNATLLARFSTLRLQLEPSFTNCPSLSFFSQLNNFGVFSQSAFISHLQPRDVPRLDTSGHGTQKHAERLTDRKLILYKWGQRTVSKPSGRVH